jgi:hypothetical protein
MASRKVALTWPAIITHDLFLNQNLKHKYVLHKTCLFNGAVPTADILTYTSIRHYKVKIKMLFFWDAAMCNLVEIDRCFTRAYCFYHQGHQYAAC